MTETTQTTTTRTEPTTIYAEERREKIRGEGRKIHAVEAVEDGKIITRCGHHFRAREVTTTDDRPDHLTGNNICYHCVRAGPQGPSQ